MTKSQKPYLRFLHSEELREKTIDLLNRIEQAEEPRQYRAALGDLVVELTNTGIDYFFIRPIELANVGFVTKKSATLGMAASLKVTGKVIRSIIGGMNKKQLLVICGYMRELMD